MSKVLIEKAHGLKMAPCATHNDRNDLSCYRLRNAGGEPISEPDVLAVVQALAALAESESRRADTTAKHCAEMTEARNRMDEARARACFERDAALAELARIPGTKNR